MVLVGFPFAPHENLLRYIKHYSRTPYQQNQLKHICEVLISFCWHVAGAQIDTSLWFSSSCPFHSPLQARVAVLDNTHSTWFHFILKGPGKREARAVLGGRCYTSWVKSGERQQKPEFNGKMQMSSCNVRFLWEPALRISAEQSAKSPL